MKILGDKFKMLVTDLIIELLQCALKFQRKTGRMRRSDVKVHCSTLIKLKTINIAKKVANILKRSI